MNFTDIEVLNSYQQYLTSHWGLYRDLYELAFKFFI